MKLLVVLLSPLLSQAASLRGLDSEFGQGFGPPVDPPGLGRDTNCNSDSDCPQIQCFVAPCDYYICGNDNACHFTRVDEEDRNDAPGSGNNNNSTTIDTGGGQFGQECGSNSCAEGEYCCNESCGICTRDGDVCENEMLCFEDSSEEIPDDGDSEVDDEGEWALVTRGDCDCQSICSVCQNFFGICVQLYCFDN